MLFVYLIYQCFGISFSLKSWIHEILILEYVIKSKCSLTSLSKADLTGTFYQAYFTMYPDTSLKSQIVLRIYFKQLFRLDKNNMASSLDNLFFFCSALSCQISVMDSGGSILYKMFCGPCHREQQKRWWTCFLALQTREIQHYWFKWLFLAVNKGK